MSSVESIRKDADELIRLSQLTESVNVKRILTIEAEKMQQVALNEEKTSAQAGSQYISRKAIRPDIRTAKIVNYGWDQSDKFLKIYVTLSGVHTYPSENVTCTFGNRCFELHVLNNEKKTDSVLAIKNLLHNIIPDESQTKIKTDMVVVLLKKTSSNHWPCVTEAEKKAQDIKTPKLDNDEDPSLGLMNLMKQMYQDGDDNMKRTIAKAWTEARTKQSPDDLL